MYFTLIHMIIDVYVYFTYVRVCMCVCVCVCMYVNWHKLGVDHICTSHLTGELLPHLANTKPLHGGQVEYVRAKQLTGFLG